MSDEGADYGDAVVIDTTANELRRLAEMADGFRNRRIALAVNPETGRLTFVDEHSVTEPVVLAVHTTDRIPPDDRPHVEVHISVDGVEVRGEALETLNHGCDTLFLSESAIEKFLFPYYAKYWSLVDLATFFEGFRNDVDAFAVCHPPGSESSIGRRQGQFKVLRRAPQLEGGVEVLTDEEYLALLRR